MKIKAVIFDLDGTLLNSIEDIADSMNAVMDLYNFNRYDNATYMNFIGDGIREFVLRALPEAHRTSEMITECTLAMKEEYGKRWDCKTTPFIGIPELLDRLHAKKIKLAILSNKPDDFTKLIVTKLLPSWPFNPVLGARQGVPRKPDPTAPLEIASIMHVHPGECAFLGDSEADILAAQAAGMLSVAAAWGFRSKEALIQAAADFVIDHPLDFPDESKSFSKIS